ncbi:MAG: multidrug effflux MFS transporter [Anaerolineae bacterium]|nr:multidrug effflux MFS transporter [Anaerolineae bacterium]
MAQAPTETILTSVKSRTSPTFLEFVVVISMMMSLTALSIDAMLPALPQIGSDLEIANPNDRQLIVSVIFLGSAVGQLFFGPLSDRTGRKPAIYAGYALYMAGSLVSVFSLNFPMMLLGRVLQGLGISAPQAVTRALIRDQFEGRKMARVMSFTMMVFILVPMVAPTIGQGILMVSGWRGIFGSFLFFALVTLVWFVLRIPETLAPGDRTPFSMHRIVHAVREIFHIRSAIGYTLVAGLVNGVFLGYLNSSQQIFQEQYGLGDLFPLFFALNSLSLGLASFTNAHLVMRFGMVKLARWSLGVVFGLAVVFVGLSLLLAGHPPLWGLMAYLMVSFFCIGILFGNINALAMQPLGHLAGIGAAVLGSLTTLISTLLGTLIGRSYNGTVLPLIIGMALLTGASIFVIRWAEQTPEPPIIR